MHVLVFHADGYRAIGGVGALLSTCHRRVFPRLHLCRADRRNNVPQSLLLHQLSRVSAGLVARQSVLFAGCAVRMGNAPAAGAALDYWCPAVSDGPGLRVCRAGQAQRRLAAAGRTDENVAPRQKSPARSGASLCTTTGWRTCSRGLGRVTICSSSFFCSTATPRPIAYGFVLLFHAATALFFPAIGMFPYVMIVSSLIFFSGEFHQKLLSWLPVRNVALTAQQYQFRFNSVVTGLVTVYVAVQLLVPMRFALYPGSCSGPSKATAFRGA